MKTKQLGTLKILLILAFALCLLAVVGLAGYQAGKGATTTGAVNVSNLFVDLNNDGRPDLLIEGAAILNEAPLLPSSTPAAKK
jgi:hypothetical protein